MTDDIFNPIRELLAQKDEEYAELLARFDALKAHAAQEKKAGAERDARIRADVRAERQEARRWCRVCGEEMLLNEPEFDQCRCPGCGAIRALADDGKGGA